MKYAIALLALMVASPALANPSMGDNTDGNFIRRDTRIQGCIMIVDKVRDGSMTPTQWLDEAGEEFQDLKLELKRRKANPDQTKVYMMGMAITICMENKGYHNRCVVSRGEDGDRQAMETAHSFSCWAKRVVEVTPPPTPVEPPREPWNRMPPTTETVPPPLTPPPMSPADLAQFNEDMATITLPPTSLYPYSNQGERFATCASYWQSLHYNRPPQVRQVLYAVRVARCMYRTGFGFFQASCPHEFPNMLNPRCYARFG